MFDFELVCALRHVINLHNHFHFKDCHMGAMNKTTLQLITESAGSGGAAFDDRKSVGATSEDGRSPLLPTVTSGRISADRARPTLPLLPLPLPSPPRAPSMRRQSRIHCGGPGEPFRQGQLGVWPPCGRHPGVTWAGRGDTARAEVCMYVHTYVLTYLHTYRLGNEAVMML